MAACQRLLFDEQVKNIDCKNCGVKGHIAKDCPDKKKKWTGKLSNDRQDNDRCDNDCRGQREKQRFKKAYKIALESLAADDSTSESDDNDTSLAANVATAGNESDSEESDTLFAAHSASIYSLLKEQAVDYLVTTIAYCKTCAKCYCS